MATVLTFALTGMLGLLAIFQIALAAGTTLCCFLIFIQGLGLPPQARLEIMSA